MAHRDDRHRAVLLHLVERVVLAAPVVVRVARLPHPDAELRRREVGGEAAKAHRQLTVYLNGAVLRPPPWDKLAELELLNPYNEQIAMDDKLSILDIKARDDRGRLFNVEMQMVSSASLRRRLGDRMETSWTQTHCRTGWATPTFGRRWEY